MGETPQGKSDKFKNFIQKLNNKEEMNVVFYGDSITTGCNSSGTPMGGNVSPYAESFPVMVQKYLEKKFDTLLNCYNTAVGGWSTSQGQNDFDSRVLSYDPDLVVLAFGMNDINTSKGLYKSMIMDMVARLNQSYPNAEIVLVSTTVPNYESDWYGNQELFVESLKELETEYTFAACADMTTMHKDLFKAGKRFRDVTGNNINHPNDFVARLYAQVILKTILGDDFVKEVL